jgi:hypothetical protein
MGKDAIFEEIIAGLADDVLLADGYENALVGRVDLPDGDVALYDYDKCIQILVKRDGMTRDEAVDYFEYNVVRSHPGPKGPVFAKIFRWEPA